MNVTELGLPGVLLIEPQQYQDRRGYFLETFRKSSFANDLGLPEFHQDNFSYSKARVLRGLHAQVKNPQAKLVQVFHGEIFDVVVDIRVGSPTFGQSIHVVLNDSKHQQLFIPKGYAHGFCVLSRTAKILYKCDAYYTPNDEIGIRWDSPKLQIPWPINNPVLSDKDAAYPLFASIATESLPDYEGLEGICES